MMCHFSVTRTAQPRKIAQPHAARRSSACKAVGGILLLISCLAAQAEGVGVLTHLAGTVAAVQADGTVRTLGINSEVQNGETLSTLDNTYARIKFKDNTEVVLRPNSQFQVGGVAYDSAQPEADNLLVSLVKGGMRMVTGLIGKRNPNQIKIETPTATVGIRGTHFGLLMCQGDCAQIPTITGAVPPDGLHLDVADGQISVGNLAGQQLIGAGQFGYVLNQNTLPAVVLPSQGIQVTMPPSISRTNAGGRSVGAKGEACECGVR